VPGGVAPIVLAAEGERGQDSVGEICAHRGLAARVETRVSEGDDLSRAVEPDPLADVVHTDDTLRHVVDRPRLNPRLDPLHGFKAREGVQ